MQAMLQNILDKKSDLRVLSEQYPHRRSSESLQRKTLRIARLNRKFPS